jgi:hypothetical protein
MIALGLGIFRNAARPRKKLHPIQTMPKMQLLVVKSFLVDLDPLAVGAKVVN